MNLQKMMKDAQQMQTRMAEMQARVEAMEVDGSAAGGAVALRLNGKNEMLSINIDPSLLNLDDKEMLEDSIIAAYRNAREKLDSASSEETQKVTSGMKLPPGMKLPF